MVEDLDLDTQIVAQSVDQHGDGPIARTEMAVIAPEVSTRGPHSHVPSLEVVL